MLLLLCYRSIDCCCQFFIDSKSLYPPPLFCFYFLPRLDVPRSYCAMEPPPPPPPTPNSLEMAAKRGAKKAAPAAASTNALEGLVGFDIETGGVFDPLGFGKNCPPEQMQWYRAAELKHGRICMLAALGQVTQHYTHWNDASGVFDRSDSAWGAMQQVRRGDGKMCAKYR